MSATDSESSIDWLATDNEDEENEREPDCTGRSGQTQRPLTPSLRPHKSAELKTVGSVWSKVGDGDGRESPSSCTDAWHRDASRLYQTPHGWGAKCTQNGVKRPHGSTVAEHQERMLISNPLEKAQVFTGKCMELQCYIHPLSSILSGLRSGRYRERLSSFQESVAIDRIQRIMGVLQNPSMGEKYVTIILKVEEMLKSWFPNVKHQDQVTVAQTEKEAPAKRIKLSPVTTDLTSVPSLTSPVVTAAPMAQGTKALRVTDLTPSGAYSASNLEWLHTSPVCSPSAGQPQAPAGARHLLPPRDEALTQDSAVSSSTDRNAKTDSAPNGPPPGKINAPCLERLLKSTESLIARKGTGGVVGNS